MPLHCPGRPSPIFINKLPKWLILGQTFYEAVELLAEYSEQESIVEKTRRWQQFQNVSFPFNFLQLCYIAYNEGKARSQAPYRPPGGHWDDWDLAQDKSCHRHRILCTQLAQNVRSRAIACLPKPKEGLRPQETDQWAESRGYSGEIGDEHSPRNDTNAGSDYFDPPPSYRAATSQGGSTQRQARRNSGNNGNHFFGTNNARFQATGVNAQTVTFANGVTSLEGVSSSGGCFIVRDSPAHHAGDRVGTNVNATNVGRVDRGNGNNTKCTNCSGCIRCKECVGCSGCIDCDGCQDCRGCIRCVDCTNCVNCIGLSNARDQTGVKA